MFKKISQNLPQILFAGLLVTIYILSASPVASGYADSDEFITAGYFFSAAHPSGYGLLVYLVGIWQRITAPILSIAHASNILASFLVASGIILFYNTSRNILRILKFENSLPAYTASMLLGFSGIIWLYAGVIEVASLSFFLTSLLVFSIIQWIHTKGSLKWWYTSWIIAGVALGFVQVYLFVLPALLLFLYTYKDLLPSTSRLLKSLIIFGISVVVSASLILPLNANKAPVSYAFNQTFDGFIGHVLRQDYEGYDQSKNIERKAFELKLSKRYITYQPQYLTFLIEIIGPIIILSAGLGIYIAFKSRHQRLTIPLLAAYFLSGIFFAGRLALPLVDEFDLEQTLRAGITHRQYIHGIYFIGIFSAIGLAHALSLLKKVSPQMTYLIVLLLIGVQFHKYFSFGFSNRPHPVNEYANELLSHLKKDAVLICSGDIACFSLLYSSAVENIRPDVTVLTSTPTYREYFLEKNIQYNKSVFSQNPRYYAHLVTHNSLTKPTYITNPSKLYIDYMGLNGDPLYLDAQGYAFEVVREKPNNMQKEYAYKATDMILKESIHPKNYFAVGLSDYFHSLHRFLGEVHAQNQNTSAAQDMFEYALSLKPGSQTVPASMLSQTIANDSPAGGKVFDQDQNQLDINSATESGDLQLAYELLNKSIHFDPENISARLQQASILAMGRYYAEAEEQLLQSLLIDPQNIKVKEALTGLSKMSQGQSEQQYQISAPTTP